MKKSLLILFVFQLCSCDGIFGISDYAGATINIADAKKSKLLKNVYIPSKNKVLINSEEYEIIEAWTSNRFNTNKSEEVNKYVYDFLIIIRNSKTKEVGLSARTTPTYNDFIKFYCKECKFGGGIVTDKLFIQFDPKKTPNSPNFIKVGFKSKNKEEIIIFEKQ
jgi:hypothetical protein